MTTHVAFLGLGAMGTRMAHHVADAGYALTIWNRSAAALNRFAESNPTARMCSDPSEAVAGADVVVSMLTDDAASHQVWIELGALNAMPTGAIMVEASTVSGAHAKLLEQTAASVGIGFVEAPVLGSRPQADAGQLVVLAAGDNEAIESVRPVIETYSSTMHKVGAVGNAATLKLVVNTLMATQIAVYAEMIGLLERSSVDVALAVDILKTLPITSPRLQRDLSLISERDFDPNFPIALVAKDVRYLAALAEQLGANVPVANAARAIYAQAAEEGYGALDISGVAERYLP
jgi:3-hydroxyisobutyrate dehydrogenase